MYFSKFVIDPYPLNKENVYINKVVMFTINLVKYECNAKLDLRVRSWNCGGGKRLDELAQSSV